MTDYTPLYEAIAGLGDVTPRAQYLYRDSQSCIQNAADLTAQVPDALASLLSAVAPARTAEDALHTAINAPDPVDPVSVFTAYQPLYAAFAAAQDTYSAYTGSQAQAQAYTDQATSEMQELTGMMTDLKERITTAYGLFQSWEPPTE